MVWWKICSKLPTIQLLTMTSYYGKYFLNISLFCAWHKFFHEFFGFLFFFCFSECMIWNQKLEDKMHWLICHYFNQYNYKLRIASNFKEAVNNYTLSVNLFIRFNEKKNHLGKKLSNEIICKIQIIQKYIHCNAQFPHEFRIPLCFNYVFCFLFDTNMKIRSNLRAIANFSENWCRNIKIKWIQLMN